MLTAKELKEIYCKKSKYNDAVEDAVNERNAKIIDCIDNMSEEDMKYFHRKYCERRNRQGQEYERLEDYVEYVLGILSSIDYDEIAKNEWHFFFDTFDNEKLADIIVEEWEKEKEIYEKEKEEEENEDNE